MVIRKSKGKEVIDEILGKEYRDLILPMAGELMIRHVNTDGGTRFYSYKNEGTSDLRNISLHSLSGIFLQGGNPQTNGKLWRFSPLKDFLNWYNGRIHGSLDYMNGVWLEAQKLKTVKLNVWCSYHN